MFTILDFAVLALLFAGYYVVIKYKTMRKIYVAAIAFSAVVAIAGLTSLFGWMGLGFTLLAATSGLGAGIWKVKHQS